MKYLMIVGRRWFNRTKGHTYHTVAIYVDGRLTHLTDRVYGYGSQYRQTATDWLARSGLLPGLEPFEYGLARYCEQNGITYAESVSDVRTKADLL